VVHQAPWEIANYVDGMEALASPAQTDSSHGVVTLNCDPLRRSVHIEKEKGGHSITFLDSQRSSTHVWQFRGFGDSLSCQAGWHCKHLQSRPQSYYADFAME
jgi:hypothetical protein